MESSGDVVSDIERLKGERNAVILAHNYQPPEVQDVADYVGDSLGLSREAAKTDADVIVFCGVGFMAETAKILSPGKTVLVPDPDAQCPMAAMITPDDVERLRRENPGAPVIAYVNTSAAVKAVSDICCTSSNALKVANSFEAGLVICIPDKHLANYVRKMTGKEVVSWNGYCPTHVRILPEHIREQKRLHPSAEVMVHPECRLDVIEMADVVCSTDGMLRHARSSSARMFIVGTEAGMVHRLQKEIPSKEFFPAADVAICPNMKRTTLHKVLHALRDMEHEVDVPSEIAEKARVAIDRMNVLS